MATRDVLEEEGCCLPSSEGSGETMIMAPRAGRWVSEQITVPVMEPEGSEAFSAGAAGAAVVGAGTF